jgi:hypothetical protein
MPSRFMVIPDIPRIMDWIFYAFIGAAILHVLEEYGYPGGFSAFMRKMAPPFAPFVTARFALIINGLFLLLCVLAASVGQQSLAISLSIAGLCLLNGLAHATGSIRSRQYVPGLVTGLFLYIPLGITAYYLFSRSGQLSVWQGAMSGILGLAYQAVPLGYLLLRRATIRSM